MIAALFLIGFAVGTLGTLIGAGGGFILIPILLFLYPNDKPEALTSISLAVVFFNALSGSIAYARKKRIHYRSALIFAIASAPGALLGAYAIRYFHREKFEFVFGFLMVAMATYLLMPKRVAKRTSDAIKRNYPVHTITDHEGVTHTLSYNVTVGVLLSIVVGFISSLLGIGGGIIHVPALVNLLDFPVHIATATSHAILVAMAAIGTTEHVVAGDFSGVWDRVIPLAPGVILGAQLGAHLSSKVKDVWIIKALALALLSVGVRLIFF